MVCYLFGAKSLSEPVIVYCELGHLEPISMKFTPNNYYTDTSFCVFRTHFTVLQFYIIMFSVKNVHRGHICYNPGAVPVADSTSHRNCAETPYRYQRVRDTLNCWRFQISVRSYHQIYGILERPYAHTIGCWNTLYQNIKLINVCLNWTILPRFFMFIWYW